MPASGKQTPTGGARRKPTPSSNHTANANNANNANTTNPELGSKSRDTETYIPVNSFNSQDVINHFDRSWKAALDSYHQPGGASNMAKAEMYKGAETMAWGSKVAPKGSTSTGEDFLAELNRKQPVAP
ncbi:hypothetical protein EC957_007172 [Mortierella hygrophila]|uniref:Uncharacterized protein n=1 Tax=Mortierella hygrophila TaxID=979708 RepID=A0A9P6FCE1_9FUNG|nr:hypothetical protein EC957_007172 [Mortierella hygrophila]